MARKPKVRIRKGEPIQATEKGLEIPIPTRRNVIHDLRKASKYDPSDNGMGSLAKK